MPRKLIIGLHGLSNKPPEAVLKDWWWKSITDGVHFHRGGRAAPTPEEREAILKKDDFVNVYWADFMYAHPSYVYASDQPYVKIDRQPPRYSPKTLDGFRKWATQTFTGVWDRVRGRLGGFGLDRLVNRFLKEKLQDLYAYWNKRIRKTFTYWEADEWHSETREISDEAMREEFRKPLSQHIAEDDEIDVLVIAHSMGTIIAYDTIVDAALDALDSHPITLITIGSPLGMPTVRRHLEKLPGQRQPAFPERRLRAWHNFADPRDLVAAVPRLSPYFKDSQGRRPIQDTLIQNDFKGRGGDSNPHKSFGYLRCPELSKVVSEFLGNP